MIGDDDDDYDGDTVRSRPEDPGDGGGEDVVGGVVGVGVDVGGEGGGSTDGVYDAPRPLALIRPRDWLTPWKGRGAVCAKIRIIFLLLVGLSLLF